MTTETSAEKEAVAIFLRPSKKYDGCDGTRVEVKLGNGKTPVPNRDVARYAAQRTAPPESGDILTAFRYEGIEEYF